MKQSVPKSIDEYIAAQPEAVRALVDIVRSTPLFQGFLASSFAASLPPAPPLPDLPQDFEVNYLPVSKARRQLRGGN
jgi:hypothetical protein